MSRNAYALDQLVGQVLEARPDAEVTYGEPDGLDVVREVSFDADTSQWLWPVLNVQLDERIANGILNNKILTLTFQPTSPLADDATPFEIANVDAILNSGMNAENELPPNDPPKGELTPPE